VGSLQLSATPNSVQDVVEEEIRAFFALMANSHRRDLRVRLKSFAENVLWRLLVGERESSSSWLSSAGFTLERAGEKTRQTDPVNFRLGKSLDELYRGYHRAGIASHMQMSGAVGYKICK